MSQHNRLAVLTSPDRIARLLITAGLQDQFHMAVAECLLQDDENIITNLNVATIATRRFNEPNVVLLWRSEIPQTDVLFGLPDASFQQRYPEKGLITKREVRAVSLARLALKPDSSVWDVGAGSGSVGVETARLCSNGHVYAIEKNAGDVESALANSRALTGGNYTLLHAKAPDGLHNWPDPNAVFIGGSGGELAELIRLSLARLKPAGWLVMNFVTFENLHTAQSTLKELNVEFDITQLQASRSKPVLDMQRLAAENPVWVVCAQKRWLPMTKSWRTRRARSD